eukprot:TRINITY_DN36728_c0_g1_i1.p3 TRINITY_DN36728_c0_g1~~TRINITY_DN36728_c0_g1_i1.p3  ORF type:complete len:124 (-),score=20.19 TRINITY_DN36728_c0_g1_i1:6-377(-)
MATAHSSHAAPIVSLASRRPTTSKLKCVTKAEQSFGWNSLPWQQYWKENVPASQQFRLPPAPKISLQHCPTVMPSVQHSGPVPDETSCSKAAHRSSAAQVLLRKSSVLMPLARSPHGILGQHS